MRSDEAGMGFESTCLGFVHLHRKSERNIRVYRSGVILFWFLLMIPCISHDFVVEVTQNISSSTNARPHPYNGSARTGDPPPPLPSKRLTKSSMKRSPRGYMELRPFGWNMRRVRRYAGNPSRPPTLPIAVSLCKRSTASSKVY